MTTIRASSIPITLAQPNAVASDRAPVRVERGAERPPTPSPCLRRPLDASSARAPQGACGVV